MELVYDLEHGKLELDGDEVCLCQGETHFGYEPTRMGKHFGCRNLVRLIVASWAINVDLKVVITTIKVFPEKERKELSANGQKMVYDDDLTQVEFWTDKCVVKSSYRKINYLFKNFFREIRPTCLDHDLAKSFEEFTGTKCRGLNFKYLPTYKTQRAEDRDVAKIMQDISKLTYQQVLDEYRRKEALEAEMRGETVQLNSQVPKLAVQSPESVPDPVPTQVLADKVAQVTLD